jgi:hypothetical protein
MTIYNSDCRLSRYAFLSFRKLFPSSQAASVANNWKKGSWKDVYTYGSAYKLKADAPDDAVDQLSKNLIVPLMEKMLADGTIVAGFRDTFRRCVSGRQTAFAFSCCSR